ncbi:MAG: hypothetical protein AAB942_00695 [Patescibacteria group bacterium]
MPICQDAINVPTALVVECYGCGQKFSFPLQDVLVDYTNQEAIAQTQQAVKEKIENALAQVRRIHATSAPGCSLRFSIFLDQEQLVLH